MTIATVLEAAAGESRKRPLATSKQPLEQFATELVRARFARKTLSTPGLLGQEQLDWLAKRLT